MRHRQVAEGRLHCYSSNTSEAAKGLTKSLGFFWPPWPPWTSGLRRNSWLCQEALRWCGPQAGRPVHRWGRTLHLAWEKAAWDCQPGGSLGSGCELAQDLRRQRHRFSDGQGGTPKRVRNPAQYLPASEGTPFGSAGRAQASANSNRWAGRRDAPRTLESTPRDAASDARQAGTL